MAEFLTPEDEPIYRVRCPIHGFIHFSKNEKKVIAQPVFQRLRFIRQLALTEYVYPGATHSRFEHSLGVMELASKYFDSLRSKRRIRKLLEGSLRRYGAFSRKPLETGRQVLRLAALLHDVGHIFFSHAVEGALEIGKHESLTDKIIRSDDGLKPAIDATYWSGCAELVAEIIRAGKDREVSPDLRILHDIVSGELDADRTDYLLRDSLHCGVEYGRFDYRRLLECLELYKDPESQQTRLALDKGGLHSFEALILARYQMTTQVYGHKVRRIYDLYLQRYYENLPEDERSALDLTRDNDFTLLTRIFKDAEERKYTVFGKFAERIASRNHHRELIASRPGMDDIKVAKWRASMKNLAERLQDYDPQTDEHSVTIHRVLRSGDQGSPYEPLVLLTDGRPSGQVGEVSQVLMKIDREYNCERLYLDKSGLSDKEFKRLKQSAEKQVRQ